MRNFCLALMTLLGVMMFSSSVFAGEAPVDMCQQERYIDSDLCAPFPGPTERVPEIDAAGGVIAIGLLAGILGLIRERNNRNK